MHLAMGGDTPLIALAMAPRTIHVTVMLGFAAVAIRVERWRRPSLQLLDNSRQRRGSPRRAQDHTLCPSTASAELGSGAACAVERPTSLREAGLCAAKWSAVSYVTNLMGAA
jgi:hypothetical protein